eukprot:CAMPEP_0170059666 /NCGR_PEP_ID=MMETSP0019_2-20121128/1865_1 /TAXON_ID=98059 /ORGANISM="Dinobryon sp., Strain UTEXLB2267" /LENGTH=243 /DNA_ID=CAMNT_0010264987 /DNA_START=486 /DNA_END=1217 /DNA_ORIENTATION=+
MTSLQLLQPRHHSIYQSINTFSVQDEKCKVDYNSLSVTILTSMAAKYLFRLNSETRAVIKHINNRYKNLMRSSYISLQLRMTDKKYEMSKEAWAWVNNLSNTAEFMKPFFQAAHTNNLFIATDNCSAVADLVSLLPAQKIFSPCINVSSASSHPEGPLLTAENAANLRRHGGLTSTYALLADIEMLRRGQHFFGLFDSNLVRMIHRLRYPVLNNSHALAVETYKDSRVGLNLNMEDIGVHFDT